MRIAIITAIAGNSRTSLSVPSVVHSGVDYYAFVDQNVNCGVWKQIILPDFTIDDKYHNRRIAKTPKILPELFLPNYDYWFWCDYTHDVVERPEVIINQYMKGNDIAVFKHTTRNCVYQEAEELKRLNYDYAHNIDNQIQFYRMLGYPEGNGLWELSTFVRKNTQRIRTLNLMFWELVCRYSSRDQLAMPFCLWKLGITPTVLLGFANGYNEKGQIGNNLLMPQIRMKIA
ncbi:MAG: DUF616 domain-containing protein [Candidatus Nanoarchaeia archaeon]|nr:DUF616 domain-containing protein [Candidatus Nanoarchaeia archaeon]